MPPKHSPVVCDGYVKHEEAEAHRIVPGSCFEKQMKEAVEDRVEYSKQLDSAKAA